NYKAGRSDSLGTTIIALSAPKPDLIVTSVTPPAQALAGAPYTVTWTVNNKGKGGATGAWVDDGWLTDDPNIVPNLSNSPRLGSVAHDGGLDSRGTYIGTLTVTLSPSAHGQYVVIVTDAGLAVSEDDETNNQGSGASQVTAVPSDLVVTSVEVLPDNRSGE